MTCPHSVDDTATSEKAASAEAPAEAAAEAPAKPSEAPAEAQAPAASAHDERTNTLLEELEKRKARAVRFGQPTEDLETQIQRVRKFGAEAYEASNVARLDTELKKSTKADAKAAKAEAKAAKAESKTPAPAEEVDVRVDY